jgi:hypothetical protein
MRDRGSQMRDRGTGRPIQIQEGVHHLPCPQRAAPNEAAANRRSRMTVGSQGTGREPDGSASI